MMQHFMGSDGFIWFKGVIEGRNDPLKIGRCRVRIFGWHTDDTDQLPTEDLPWAHPSYPLNDMTHKSPPEGTWVWGFFADGAAGQLPIIVGVLPGIPPQT